MRRGLESSYLNAIIDGCIVVRSHEWLVRKSAVPGSQSYELYDMASMTYIMPLIDDTLSPDFKSFL